MSNITIKKSLIILVACLMLALVVFTACDGAVAFTPVETITGAIDESTNGGIAVKYGDYIYYVNGYQSDKAADNDYTNDVRTGAIVRVKASALDEIVALNDEQLTSAEITERIATSVKNNVEVVVPCFYFSANTTNTDLTGLHIFNDRIYITTPNQALTVGGNNQYDQLVLRSYALNGDDQKEHFTFTVANTTEIMLANVNGEVYATYANGTNLCSVKVSEGEYKVIAEEVSSVKYDAHNKAVYFIKDSAICQYNAGGTADDVKTLVAKADDITNTITNVTDGYVYYTQANALDSTMDGKTTFYATWDSATNKAVNGTLMLASLSSYKAWGSKAVFTEEDDIGSGIKIYNVYATYVDNGVTKKDLLFSTRNSVTLAKVVDDVVYYTMDSVSYTRNLADASSESVAYAKSVGTTAQGWAMPDVLGNYTFTLTSTGTVNIVKYDAVKNVNSASTNVTRVAEEVAE